jgi:arylsulfatase A-like enzyme
MADQFNANCLGIVQNQVKTPNLDELAHSGVRFERAYCNNPICGPSRSTFISGQYPHTHGVMGNGLYDIRDRNENTLPAVMRRMGYQTAVIGKAHLIGEWIREGFEYTRFCDLCDCEANDPLQNHYYKYLHDHGIADLYDLGRLKPDHPGRSQRGFDSPIPYCHSVETWTGDSTLEFLQNRDETRPFFLHMSFLRPHDPLSVPYDRGLLYDPAQIELPESACDFFENLFAGKPEPMRRHAESWGGYPYIPESKADLQRQLAYYFSLVTLIDEQIGRVFDWLKQRGEYDNTIIIFTADHGDYAGEHGMVLKNIGIYESIQRIPFILKYPGGPNGQAVSEMIESVDMFPTLCELSRVAVPACVEGRSIVPIIEGKEPGKQQAVCEWIYPRLGKRINAIRTADYRMVHYGYKEGGELYDLRSDPHELNNIYDDPSYREIRLELLERIVDHVNDHMLKASPKLERVTDKGAKNSLTRKVHKGMKSWSEIVPLYRP